jgi:hypothetical protein
MTPVAPAAFCVSLIEAGNFSSAQDHLPRVRLDKAKQGYRRIHL